MAWIASRDGRQEKPRMSEPLIDALTLGPWQVRTYLVACPRTRLGVVIDPAGEAERVAEMVRAAGVTVLYLLHTHGHQDHTQGSLALQALVGGTLAMHAADDDFFGAASGPRAELRLRDGQELAVGEMTVRVIHTPGHTPGSVCYLIGGSLFTGDTLFVGAVGRTDLAGASMTELLESIARKIMSLPDDTVILPGHDYGETPTSTLAWERRENPFITDFILES
jgi:glyoxylase-like metal-dependent hydrolase (beta-lactamase superfamily II)